MTRSLSRLKDTQYISRVNFKNMIQNLADMYSFNVDEVVLVECIANSLDAKASKIIIDFNPERRILSIQDDGNGMVSSQFREYHDFAMALKTRGEGIGFAGLGAKISFNIAYRVVTETCSEGFSGGSDWGFNEKGDLVWKPIQIRRENGTGTKVQVFFSKTTKVKYKNTEDIKEILFRHYTPLFDEKFLEFYSLIKCYERSPRFVVNGTPINPVDFKTHYQMSNYEQFLLKTRDKGAKPIGYAFFGLVPDTFELEEPGVLLCTWGKVVKPDFLNQYPGELMHRIFCIAEIPNLVKFLTTSKSDFNRRRNPKEFNTYYSPLRDKFTDWLKTMGIDRREEMKGEESKELEREISRIMASFPEISELMHRWASKKVHMISSKGEEAITEAEGSQTIPEGKGTKGISEGIIGPDVGGEDQAYIPDKGGKKRGTSISRRSRAGLKFAFSNVPEKEEIGWVDGDIVYINSGHPSYKKTSLHKRSRLLFNLVAVATALQRYLGSGEDGIDINFVDKFLYSWGK